VLQEFVRMDPPEVFRLYAVAGETFGWNVRRFPDGGPTSPWVAHVRGARYFPAGAVPPAAEQAVRQALRAADLLESFGCADLIQRGTGEWLVLEVGTDGLYSYVDRDIHIPDLAEELEDRLAMAFHTRSSS
jgi:hypothetical protein